MRSMQIRTVIYVRMMGWLYMHADDGIDQLTTNTTRRRPREITESRINKRREELRRGRRKIKTTTKKANNIQSNRVGNYLGLGKGMK